MRQLNSIACILIVMLMIAVAVHSPEPNCEPSPTFPPLVVTTPAPSPVVLTPSPSPVVTLAPTHTPTPTSDPIPYGTPIPYISPSVEPTEQQIFCGLTDNLPFFVYNENIPLSEDLQATLYNTCVSNGVPMALMLGLIETESGFNPYADNGQCYGLCQLCKLYFPDDLPPGENIIQGVELLASHYRKYGSWESALTAFNVGHDNGTRTYANIVLERAEKWGYIP